MQHTEACVERETATMTKVFFVERRVVDGYDPSRHPMRWAPVAACISLEQANMAASATMPLSPLPYGMAECLPDVQVVEREPAVPTTGGARTRRAVVTRLGDTLDVIGYTAYEGEADGVASLGPDGTAIVYVAVDLSPADRGLYLPDQVRLQVLARATRILADTAGYAPVAWL